MKNKGIRHRSNYPSSDSSFIFRSISIVFVVSIKTFVESLDTMRQSLPFYFAVRRHVDTPSTGWTTSLPTFSNKNILSLYFV